MSDTAPATGETAEATADAPDLSELADLSMTPDQIRQAIANSRKWEQRAKDNKKAADELAAQQRASMTEQEQAIAAARDEARAQALREVGSARVEDALRAAAAGRDLDVDALLDGLDRGRFLGEDGEPDREQLASWVDRVAPRKEQQNTPTGFPDLGQGARGDTSTLALGSDPLLQSLTNMVGAPRR